MFANMFMIQPCVRAACWQVPKVQRPSKNVCQWPELLIKNYCMINQAVCWLEAFLMPFLHSSMLPCVFLNLVHHCFVVPVISIRSSRPVTGDDWQVTASKGLPSSHLLRCSPKSGFQWPPGRSHIFIGNLYHSLPTVAPSCPVFECFFLGSG